MQPFIGEIRAFAGDFAPVGWLLCDGSLQQIEQYEVLYNLIGNTYGGDRFRTFGLPDLRGRLIVQNGQLAGGSNYQLGRQGGVESVTVTAATMASHFHMLAAGTVRATTNQPNNCFLAAPNDTGNPNAQILAYLPYDQQDQTQETVKLHPDVLATVGGSGAHENRQPFLCVTYIISTQGIFPTFP